MRAKTINEEIHDEENEYGSEFYDLSVEDFKKLKEDIDALVQAAVAKGLTYDNFVELTDEIINETDWDHLGAEI